VTKSQGLPEGVLPVDMSVLRKKVFPMDPISVEEVRVPPSRKPLLSPSSASSLPQAPPHASALSLSLQLSAAAAPRLKRADGAWVRGAVDA
jgi:hypothetical protein